MPLRHLLNRPTRLGALRRIGALASFVLALNLPCVAASLTVAAAADMAGAEQELTEAFHKTYPADSVRFVFAASGALSQQIANGAPYDVFLSANEAFVDQLAAGQKVVPSTVFVYALGQLGVLWRDGRARNWAALKDESIRLIAIANPKLAPYGLAAQQSLEHEGLWDAIRTKIVFGQNVRQALQLFDSGNADVVLTAYSLMIGRNGTALVPEEWHQSIRQKAGIVAASKNLETARNFLAFLHGPAGSKILSAHGLKPAK